MREKKETREEVVCSTLATSFYNTCLPEETGTIIPLGNSRRKVGSSYGKFSFFYGLKITKRTSIGVNPGNVESIFKT